MTPKERKHFVNIMRYFLVLAFLLWLPALQAQQPEGGETEPKLGKVRRGMTWVLKKKDGDLSCVGRHDTTDAYRGDTPCTTSLPILAIKRKKLPKPESLMIESEYYQWSGGVIALTKPVEGSRLTSLEEANRIIQEQLGPGWEMAEFHDGWGWNFWAYGDIAHDQHFWVFINDQPANPWDSVPE